MTTGGGGDSDDGAGRAPVWLEVALNGPWTKPRQPLIPVSVADVVAEGIACVRAGAAIVHVHAYDERSGEQDDDADTYARIIEGIRAEVDAIVYPSVPLSGPDVDSSPLGASARYCAVDELGRRGLLEWAVVDPGSVHLATREDVRDGRDGLVYHNPQSHLRHALGLARHHRFVPSYAIYEPGFIRLGAAAHAASGASTPAPVYRFMFSDQFTFGFPPAVEFLDACLTLLGREAPGAPWMVSGLGVDVMPLLETAVARGGHVRVGLEDSPLGCRSSNVQLVKDAARRIADAGGRLASADDVRQSLRSASGPGRPTG